MEPNFQSEAYKEQAKEIFKRRMHYNPREAASRSRERVATNASQTGTATIDQQSQPMPRFEQPVGSTRNAQSPSKTEMIMPKQNQLAG